MVIPKADLFLDLLLRLDGQTPQGGVRFGLGTFGLTILSGIAPRPGSTGLGQFPRFAPDTAAT